MSNDLPPKRKFTAVIDLTSRATEKSRAETAEREFQASDAVAPPEIGLEDLPERLRSAVTAAGWPGLMPVQARAIPPMLDGRDLIVQSKTGSGKTGAFLLPFFELLDPARNGAQALVLTPTRELARQIYTEFERLKAGVVDGDRLRGALVYGGVSYNQQNLDLRGGAQLVVGTPGRVLDHLERRTFSLDGLRVLVLDEADEMLSMGFLPAMKKLRRYLPDRRQSTMFSATMPPSVRSLAGEFLHEPTFLALSGGTVQIDALSHRFYVVPGMDRDRALVRVIELENPESAIVFANTKKEVEYLATFLRNYGHDAGEISGDLSQGARETIMQRVREGKLRFLVATDVAARGIDISDLTHVIMFDVPQDTEYYVHRAGRTARAGKTGTAISLVSPESKNKLMGIFRRYDLPFEERPMPTDEEVMVRVRERLTILLEERYRTTKTLSRERIARFDPLVRELALEEPHLLSMLLDGLYHETLHAAPQADIIASAAERVAERIEKRDAERAERAEGRGGERGGPRRERGGRERAPEREGDRERRREPRPDEAPAHGEALPAPPEAGDASDGERKKKRKKRKKKPGAGADLETNTPRGDASVGNGEDASADGSNLEASHRSETVGEASDEVGAS